MEKSERHHFVSFPYRPAIREDGEINNGGFDLTLEPERISEIHEIKDYPWFRDFLISVNTYGLLFMTFGCALGSLEESFCGYIDFSLRPDSPTHLRVDLSQLDDLFYQYLAGAMPDEETRIRGIEYARSILHWTLSPLEIRGESYAKVTLTFDASQQEGVAWVFDHLSYYLTISYPSLPHVMAG